MTRSTFTHAPHRPHPRTHGRHRGISALDLPDLACLIRRVKARLKTPKNHLCCVGTSATLGGKDSTEAMIEFAELIFGETFVDEPIINETRKEAQDHKLIINSFVSLCAVARDAPRDGAHFLQIRAELWMRELARMVASVSPRPTLRFSMDLPADHPQKHLAAMHCRECGVMGWGTVQKSNEQRLIPDLDRFY